MPAEGRIPVGVTKSAAEVGIDKGGYKSWIVKRDKLRNIFKAQLQGVLVDSHEKKVPPTEDWAALVECALQELHAQRAAPGKKQNNKPLINQLESIIARNCHVGKKYGLSASNIRVVLAEDASRFRDSFEQCVAEQPMQGKVDLPDGKYTDCHFFCMASTDSKLYIRFQGN